MYRTLAVLVENSPGVLARVAGYSAGAATTLIALRWDAQRIPPSLA
ncbi:hypothetical protein N752_10600 [Desulforamulus aquiferis]|nr:hypothetical protein N752_10600 [Desulforamulus aquiferis]